MSLHIGLTQGQINVINPNSSDSIPNTLAAGEESGWAETETLEQKGTLKLTLSHGKTSQEMRLRFVSKTAAKSCRFPLTVEPDKLHVCLQIYINKYKYK